MLHTLDCWGVDPHLLDDEGWVHDLLEFVARESGATVIETTSHHFSPVGVTGVCIIAESHLAAHTWPERHYLAVDFFTCGDKVDTDLMVHLLLRDAKPSSYELQVTPRGILKGRTQHKHSWRRRAWRKLRSFLPKR